MSEAVERRRRRRHSSDINDEPIDPRIHTELERANAATSDINNLETQFDEAQRTFQATFTSCKQRLAHLAKDLGRSIERARPFHEICKQTDEAQADTHQAAHDYQLSVELYHSAMADVRLVESQRSSRADVHTWQESFRRATIKLRQAEQDKRRCEQVHAEKSKRYQNYEQQRVALHRSWKRAITKSKPYFDAKSTTDDELKNQKLRIEDVQKAISQAKRSYRSALTNLEQISEEIHTKRRNQISLDLPARESGVGSDQPDQFVEFAQLGSRSSLSEPATSSLADTPKCDLPTSMSRLSTDELPGTSIACTDHDPF